MPYLRALVTPFVLSGLLMFIVPLRVSAEVESGDAKSVTGSGASAIDTIVKKDGKECQTGLTSKCVVGKPCFSNITITGETAKQMYNILLTHGIKSSEVVGNYVATKSEAMQCFDNDDVFTCMIGYDAVANTMTSPDYCDPE